MKSNVVTGFPSLFSFVNIKFNELTNEVLTLSYAAGVGSVKSPDYVYDSFKPPWGQNCSLILFDFLGP